jgi:hypothetical protein
MIPGCVCEGGGGYLALTPPPEKILSLDPLPIFFFDHKWGNLAKKLVGLIVPVAACSTCGRYRSPR